MANYYFWMKHKTINTSIFSRFYERILLYVMLDKQIHLKKIKRVNIDSIFQEIYGNS